MTTTQTQQVYRSYGTARGWRIFIYLFSPLLIALFWSVPFWMPAAEWDALRIGFAVSMTLFGFFFLYCLYETIKARHLITDTSLVYAGAIYRKELPLEAIQGFRTNQQYTFILPKSKAYPKIRIGYTSEGYEEIQQWLAEHYPNLDEQEQKQEEEALLEDYTLGRTVSEREETLGQARKVAKWLNLAGMATAGWLFFLPKPYEVALAAALALPIIAALALFWHRTAMRPDEQKNSAYPSLAAALFMPSLGLLLRCLFDFELLSYSSVWAIAGLVAAGFGGFLLLSSQEFLRQPKSRWSAGLSVVAYALLYGYAATVSVNCAFDGEPTQHYQATVLSKHYSSGKSTTYYLHVSPWGPRTEPEDITVTEEHYEHAASGEPVHIYQMSGRLGIPWFIAIE